MDKKQLMEQSVLELYKARVFLDMAEKKQKRGEFLAFSVDHYYGVASGVARTVQAVLTPEDSHQVFVEVSKKLEEINIYFPVHI